MKRLTPLFRPNYSKFSRSTRKFNKIVLLGDNQASSVLLKNLVDINSHTQHFPYVNTRAYKKIDQSTLIVLMHDIFQYPGQNEWYMRLQNNNKLINNSIGVVTTRKLVYGIFPDLDHKQDLVKSMLYNEVMTLGYGWRELTHDHVGINNSHMMFIISAIERLYYTK